MTIIICEDKCSKCNQNFVKDPLDTSDWYETVIGMVLQRYCPECGRMLPLVRNDKDMIKRNVLSNNMKRRIAVRIAKKYGIVYAVSCRIAKQLWMVDDIDIFAKKFSNLLSKKIKNIEITPRMIKEVYEGI